MPNPKNNIFQANAPKKTPKDILNAGKPQDIIIEEVEETKKEIATTKDDNVIPIKKEELIQETQEIKLEDKVAETPTNKIIEDDDFIIESKTDKKEKDYINFYLKIENIEKLKKLAQQTGKKQSVLLDEILDKAFKRVKVKEK
jgi:hypothetical protein